MHKKGLIIFFILITLSVQLIFLVKADQKTPTMSGLQLIRQAQSNHYWATINEDKFEALIQKLSPLMKFREAVVPLAPAKFNLKDIVAEKEFVEFGPQHEALSVAKYRELVEQKINELVSSSPILQKLKQGNEITNESIKPFNSNLMSISIQNRTNWEKNL